MAQALTLAEAGAAAGEVPVGAVVVNDGQVIARAHNQNIALKDPSAHAEMLALREAARILGNYRLEDCTLYVTLEPCAMCSGAILNARLKNVVYGANEPRTGAAGSVVDLFAQKQLNHQTEVRGGVLSEACAQVIKDFFKPLRANPSPLRDDALRTPDSAFANLPDYPWAPHYLSDLASAPGLRLHYLDEGTDNAAVTWLCLHGEASWSYWFRHMMPVLLAQGHRVVVPDLIGFGKSDKPKKQSFHDFERHHEILLELIERLNLNQVLLVLQGANHQLGHSLALASPSRFKGGVVLHLASMETCGLSVSAYQAPFPDQGHQAGVRAFRKGIDPTLEGDRLVTLRQVEPFFELSNFDIAEPNATMAQAAVRHFCPI